MPDNIDPLGYYKSLGLAPNATQAQILHAYREWAKQYHPDVTGSTDSSEFRRIKEAYDHLSDPSLRSRYDGLQPKGNNQAQPRTTLIGTTISNSRDPCDKLIHVLFVGKFLLSPDTENSVALVS